ncbi:MAG: sulfotransferase [Bacteroidota bacterium]
MSPLSPTVDFFCIGAQKAGTTWLYRRLLELPEFTLPPEKELHYFSRSSEYISCNKLNESSLIKRLSKSGWLSSALHQLDRSIDRDREVDYHWKLKWFFSDYTDQWYLSLFDKMDGIKGDISPSYAILKEQDIRKMFTLFPDVKIIFILRNPIERAWSQYRHISASSRSIDKNNLDVKSITQFVLSEFQEARSDYLTTLNRYLKVIPPQQLMIAFFDAIKTDPVLFLMEVVHFLGGDASKVPIHCKAKEKNNVSPKFSPPPEITLLLKHKYQHTIKELSNTIGGYSTQWYNQAYDYNKPVGKLFPTLML